MSTRRFAARSTEFEAIRQFVESNAGVMPQDDQYRVLLLVEELFANSVMHGYAGDSDSPVWLTVIVSNGTCRIVYEDEAPEYDPFTGGHQPQLEGDDRPVGGLGIMLLTEMSSSHSYARRGGRNVIEFEVPLGPGPGSAISV